MLCKVTHCAGRVSANARPHQLRWGDWEMMYGVTPIQVYSVSFYVGNAIDLHLHTLLCEGLQSHWSRGQQTVSFQ